jgi:hypothetical protein
VLRGISAALFEKVTIQNGVVDQDWYRTGIDDEADHVLRLKLSRENISLPSI